MNINEDLEKFRSILQAAVDFREKVLFPQNPLFEVQQSIVEQETTQKEVQLLKCILSQFDKIFPEAVK